MIHVPSYQKFRLVPRQRESSRALKMAPHLLRRKSAAPPDDSVIENTFEADGEDGH